MFLGLLNTSQQRLFLDTAVTMAHVDDHFHLNEQAFVERVRRETGHDLEQSSPLNHAELVERATAEFSDGGVAARAFLGELSNLVVADGQQTASELELLRELADAVQVPAADVPVFLDFAQRALELGEDARDLLAMSNVDA